MTIIMRTRRTATDVTYFVFLDERQVWSKTVRFGRRERDRAGGPAFVEAAQQQAAIAEELAGGSTARP